MVPESSASLYSEMKMFSSITRFRRCLFRSHWSTWCPMTPSSCSEDGAKREGTGDGGQGSNVCHSPSACVKGMHPRSLKVPTITGSLGDHETPIHLQSHWLDLQTLKSISICKTQPHSNCSPLIRLNFPSILSDCLCPHPPEKVKIL